MQEEKAVKKLPYKTLLKDYHVTTKFCENNSLLKLEHQSSYTTIISDALILPGDLLCASRRLQQAIRAVTSGANGCYGQLVVLGYKVSKS